MVEVLNQYCGGSAPRPQRPIHFCPIIYYIPQLEPNSMHDEGYTVKTVAELKKILQEYSLPVSGKKADLVARLEEYRSASTSKPAKAETAKSNANELPFLAAIFENGISSVKLETNNIIRYGATAFMFVIIIVGLNSNSWYNIEINSAATKAGIGVSLGFFEWESTESINGKSTKTSQSYDGQECQSGSTPFFCDGFSIAGIITAIMLWISMLAIIAILVIGIAQGFGKLNTGFVVDNKDKIEKYSWLLATLPILIGTIIYGIMASFLPGGNDTAMPGTGYSQGLGGTWWLIFILSIAYSSYIYRERLQTIGNKLSNSADSPDN